MPDRWLKCLFAKALRNLNLMPPGRLLIFKLFLGAPFWCVSMGKVLEDDFGRPLTESHLGALEPINFNDTPLAFPSKSMCAGQVAEVAFAKALKESKFDASWPVAYFQALLGSSLLVCVNR